MDPTEDSAFNLRHRAEARLREQVAALPTLSREEILRLVHELDVYRIELEMQNQELRESREALQESRNRYADLFDFAPLAYVTLDETGAVREANLVACALLETDRGRVERGMLLATHVLDDDKTRFRQHLEQCRLAGAATGAVTTELRLTGKKVPVTYVRLRSMMLDSPHGARYRTAITNITALKRAEEQLRQLSAVLERRVSDRTALAEQRAAELRFLAGQLTQTEEHERRRLAQTLHDGLQQVLYAASLALHQAKGRADGHDEIMPYLARLQDLLGEAMGQSRMLTTELSPPVLYDVGLAAALEWLARHTEEQHGLKVAVRAEVQIEPLAEDLRAFLYRAVAELLFNVAKHAGTDRAEVALSGDEQTVEIVVSDPGAGFDLMHSPAVPSSGGIGLFSIRERAEFLGGSMSIETRPGSGTRVALRIPHDLPQKEPVAASSAPAAPPSAGPVAEGDQIRVLLADDHPILRQGLAGMLDEQPDIELVGQAGDGIEAVEMARRFQPDVVLMDVTMPQLDGIEATRRILAEMPLVHVIGLSMHEADEMAVAMRAAGAAAYLSKGGAFDQLLATIRSTAADQVL